MTAGLRLVGPGEVAAALDPHRLVDAVRRAFVDHAAGRLLAPDRADGYAGAGEFHVKTGAANEVFTVKANSGFFANPPRRPAIQGVVVAFALGDGTPLAVIDSPELTAARTAAVSAVAAVALARPGAGRLALIGAGAQARAHLRLLAAVLDLDRVAIWSRSADRAGRAVETARGLGLAARVAASPQDAVADADIVVTVTPSRAALLTLDDIGAGAFVAAVGADSPGKQELDAALLAGSRVVTDLTEQCARAGELRHAIAAGLMTTADVTAELGDVLAGSRPGRRDPDEIVVFDAVGTGFADAAAASVVLETIRPTRR